MAGYAQIRRSDLQFGRVLGTGGFSTVYHAVWMLATARSKEVAVKKLNAMESKELEIMSQLDHSHIIKLLGVVDESPDFFLVLELCHGGTLREYLDTFTNKRLPFSQFLDWMKQAALPVQYLREKGVVHKDIKSPNYLITSENVLKLSDFGTAKKVDITMSNATTTASYPWMAPELLKDLKLSPNYDIFSYGVVVWELWTTDFPHKGLEPQVIAWRVCQENQRLPIPDDCPKSLVNLMDKSWESDWRKRPSFDQILHEIAKLMRSTAAGEIPSHILHSQWKLDRRIGHDGPDGVLYFPYSIAINHLGDTFIADHWAAKIHVYNQQGVHKFSIDTKQGQHPRAPSHPSEVKVSLDGRVFLTDMTEFVKVFGPDGELVKKWPAVSPQNKSSDTESTCLVGLTFDAKACVLVGELNRRYVSKYDQDGIHISSFNVDIAPRSLAVSSKETIIVGDWDKSAVHIVDHSGQLLHTVQRPPQVDVWHPMGIACYEDICSICDHKNKTIHCFTLSGTYQGHILLPIAGKPRSIAFLAGGKHLIISYDTRLFNGEVALYTCIM